MSQSNVASLNATTTGPVGGVAGGMGVNAAGPSAGGSLLDLDPLDPLSTMGSTPPVAGQNQGTDAVNPEKVCLGKFQKPDILSLVTFAIGL